MMVIIIIVIIFLFHVLVLNMSNIAKIWICGPWYYKEELFISDIECWNTFICNWSWWYC